MAGCAAANDVPCQRNTQSGLGKPRDHNPTQNIVVTSKSPVGDVSVVTLIRTDTTLDHSQKAEKVWQWNKRASTPPKRNESPDPVWTWSCIFSLLCSPSTSSFSSFPSARTLQSTHSPSPSVLLHRLAVISSSQPDFTAAGCLLRNNHTRLTIKGQHKQGTTT